METLDVTTDKVRRDPPGGAGFSRPIGPDRPGRAHLYADRARLPSGGIGELACMVHQLDRWGHRRGWGYVAARSTPATTPPTSTVFTARSSCPARSPGSAPLGRRGRQSAPHLLHRRYRRSCSSPLGGRQGHAAQCAATREACRPPRVRAAHRPGQPHRRRPARRERVRRCRPPSGGRRVVDVARLRSRRPHQRRLQRDRAGINDRPAGSSTLPARTWQPPEPSEPGRCPHPDIERSRLLARAWPTSRSARRVRRPRARATPRTRSSRRQRRTLTS